MFFVFFFFFVYILLFFVDMAHHRYLPRALPSALRRAPPPAAAYVSRDSSAVAPLPTTGIGVRWRYVVRAHTGANTCDSLVLDSTEVRGVCADAGPSRCFSFWQDFRKCYVTAESAGECMPQKDDYLECLHHTKEVRGCI